MSALPKGCRHAQPPCARAPQRLMEKCYAHTSIRVNSACQMPTGTFFMPFPEFPGGDTTPFPGMAVAWPWLQGRFIPLGSAAFFSRAFKVVR